MRDQVAKSTIGKNSAPRWGGGGGRHVSNTTDRAQGGDERDLQA